MPALSLVLLGLFGFDPQALYLWTAGDGESVREGARFELLLVSAGENTNYFGWSDWSGDGRTIAVDGKALDEQGRANPNEAVFLVDPETGAAQSLATGSVASWSADERRLAMTRWRPRDRGLVLVDAETGQSRSLGMYFWPQWLPGEGEILVHADGEFFPTGHRLLNVETGQLREVQPRSTQRRAKHIVDAGRAGLVTIAEVEGRDSVCLMTLDASSDPVRYDLTVLWQQPEGYFWLHDPKIALDSGDVFFTVARAEAPVDEDDERTDQQRQIVEVWRMRGQDPTTAAPILRSRPGQQISEISPSPDGRRLAVASNLYYFTPPDGGIVFEDDLLVPPDDDAPQFDAEGRLKSSDNAAVPPNPTPANSSP